METNSNKKYKYQFNKTFYVIAIVGALVALLCIGINVYRFISLSVKDIVPGFYEYLSLILAVVLSIGFIVFVASALIKSYYEVTEKAVILRWGVVKNTLKAEEIEKIRLVTDNNQLELIFKDESYFIINVSSKDKEEFVNDVKSKFENVLYLQETEKPSET